MHALAALIRKRQPDVAKEDLTRECRELVKIIFDYSWSMAPGPLDEIDIVSGNSYREFQDIEYLSRLLRSKIDELSFLDTFFLTVPADPDYNFIGILSDNLDKLSELSREACRILPQQAKPGRKTDYSRQRFLEAVTYAFETASGKSMDEIHSMPMGLRKKWKSQYRKFLKASCSETMRIHSSYSFDRAADRYLEDGRPDREVILESLKQRLST